MVYTEQLVGGEQRDLGSESEAAELRCWPLTLPGCRGCLLLLCLLASLDR